MSFDLEKELRQALRPVEPETDLAQRVGARIEAARWRRRWAKQFAWAPAALAASLVLAIVSFHQWQLRRERQGLAARAQLIQALRLTGAKLDLAYRDVSGAARPVRADDAGA
jgi:type VI protein secretion system component VasF